MIQLPPKKILHLFLAQSCWMSWAPKIDVKFGNPTPPHPIFIYLSPARAGARAPAARIFSPPGGIISAIDFMYELISHCHIYIYIYGYALSIKSEIALTIHCCAVSF